MERLGPSVGKNRAVQTEARIKFKRRMLHCRALKVGKIQPFERFGKQRRASLTGGAAENQRVRPDLFERDERSFDASASGLEIKTADL